MGGIAVSGAVSATGGALGGGIEVRVASTISVALDGGGVGGPVMIAVDVFE